MSNYYITADDVKGKAITEIITRSGWVDADIDKVIAETENYVNTKLVPLGYTTTQLATAPLVDTICILYSRYCVLRDVYLNNTAFDSAGNPYEKWREVANEFLEKIQKRELKLVDTTGVIIAPTNRDKRFDMNNNTSASLRIFDLGDSEDLAIDSTNYDTDVVGET